MARAKQYSVYVYRPSGARLCILECPSMNAEIAVGKAKRKVYRMGHLAHFYTYVPKLQDE